MLLQTSPTNQSINANFRSKLIVSTVIVLFIFQNRVAKQDENDFKVEHKLPSGPFDYFSCKYMFMIRNETFV